MESSAYCPDPLFGNADGEGHQKPEICGSSLFVFQDKFLSKHLGPMKDK